MTIRINNRVTIETESWQQSVSEAREFFAEQNLTESERADREYLLENFRTRAERIEMTGGFLECKYKNLSLSGHITKNHNIMETTKRISYANVTVKCADINAEAELRELLEAFKAKHILTEIHEN